MQPYDPYQQQPQQPWPQQPQQQQWQQQQYQQQPKRSPIPKVIGILMIIFGGLGILGGLWSLLMSSAMSGFSSFGHHSYGAFGGGDTDGFDAVSRFTTFSKFTAFLGLGIAVTQLMAGIALVGYKAKGIKLAVAYAIANMVISVISAIIVFAVLKPAMSRYGFGELVGIGMMLGTVISLAWPIVVLALVNRPAAKAACTGF
jgi:hypothetical protein